MYQETLDALNADKTTRQHSNAMKALFERTTDPKLKELIGAVVSEFESWLQKMKMFANQKTPSPVSKKKNVATAKAARAKTFIASAPAPMPDGNVPPSVKALIAYCKSKI